MNKKDKTIRAFLDLAVKYLTPGNKVFFKEENCYLCDVHLTKRDIWHNGKQIWNQDGTRATRHDCKGCPLASETGTCECIGFETYTSARSAYREHRHIIDGSPCNEFKRRAEFFKKYLPIIKKWPTERFTKKGWIYSGNEISRED